MTSPDLDAIQARADAATEGPWFYGISYHGERGPIPLDYESPGYYDNGAIMSAKETIAGCGEYHIFNSTADIDFIAHSRTDIPALISRVRELEATLQKYGDHLDSCKIRHGTPHPCNCGFNGLVS